MARPQERPDHAEAWAPATIAAVWSGRRYAEELDAPDPARTVPFRREKTALVQ